MKSEDKVVDEDEEMPVGDMVSSIVGDMVTATMPDLDIGPLQSYDAPTPNGGNSPAIAPEEPKTPKAKKPAKPRASNVTPSGKNKRAADEDGDNDAFTTPTKKIKATAGTPRSGNGKGMAIGTSKDDLSNEDKVLVQMKQDGKTWPEIREKWKEMTGKIVGGSTLPNRYARIIANLTDWKDGDVSYYKSSPDGSSSSANASYQIERMIFANEKVIGALAEEVEVKRKLLAEEVEAKRREIDAQLRKLEGEVYSRMSVVMVQLGSDTYSAAAIEKAFLKEKREGFPHKETMAKVINGVAAAVGGDQDMEGAESSDEGNSDGGVPISPRHGFNSQEDSSQNGLGASIKGEDNDMDSDMI